jgi:hypothetical protein
MDEKSRKYLEQYMKIDETTEKKINNHIKRYSLNGHICAYYSDYEDFCSDWCDDIGYTRTQARKLLHGGIGEFMYIPNSTAIIRFEI